MLNRITENLSTIIVAAVLIFIVGLVIRGMIRNRRAGKSSCGCGCQSCAMQGKCHPTKPGYDEAKNK